MTSRGPHALKDTPRMSRRTPLVLAQGHRAQLAETRDRLHSILRAEVIEHTGRRLP
jgi:hypothetical protein